MTDERKIDLNGFAGILPFGWLGDTTCPDNCLWCGRKLRTNKSRQVRRHKQEQNVREGELLQSMPWLKHAKSLSHRTTPYEPLRGDYCDGAFCGLRCGYAFGVALARFGHRLEHGGNGTISEKESAS